MKNKLINLLTVTALIVLPLAAFAQGSIPPPPQGGFSGGNIGSKTQEVVQYFLDYLWVVFSGYAIIMFIIAGYYFAMGKPDEGKKIIVYGAAGVALGILAWGIPNLVSGWI